MKYCHWMSSRGLETITALGLAHTREPSKEARRLSCLAEVTVTTKEGMQASFLITGGAVAGMDDCFSWLAVELFKMLSRTHHRGLHVSGVYTVTSPVVEEGEGEEITQREPFAGEYMSSDDFFDGIYLESASGRSALRVRPRSLSARRSAHPRAR